MREHNGKFAHPSCWGRRYRDTGDYPARIAARWVLHAISVTAPVDFRVASRADPSYRDAVLLVALSDDPLRL